MQRSTNTPSNNTEGYLLGWCKHNHMHNLGRRRPYTVTKKRLRRHSTKYLYLELELVANNKFVWNAPEQYTKLANKISFQGL